DDAVEWRAYDTALQLGLCSRQRRLRCHQLSLEINQLELRRSTRHNQLALGLELRAALGHERFRLCDLGLAGIVGEYCDDIAYFHPRPAAHPQFSEHATGPRRH